MNDAINNSESLFVINNSGRRDATGKTTRVSGIIVLHITPEKGGDSNGISVVVKNTWLPQDLALQALASDIRRNTQFRSLINGNNLKLVDEVDARRILETPEAEKERVRVEERADRSLRFSEEFTVSGSETEQQQLDSITEEAFEGLNELNQQARMPGNIEALLKDKSTVPPKNLDAAPVETSIPVQRADSNMATAILNKFSDGLVSENEAIDALSAIGSMLSESDVHEALKHPASNVNIRSILNTRLNPES